MQESNETKKIKFARKTFPSSFQESFTYLEKLANEDDDEIDAMIKQLYLLHFKNKITIIACTTN